MSSLKSECRKFSPNIFNKNKCQNCFRTKETHSAEALQSNRSTRKVSKCGYLFVAPDWDFTVSINRTKRWQRRWFVLYDDGELTYSVDEHPDTVPQAVIDMNIALEVSDAQEITGNQYAIAITAPEKVHFVKGTSREESKWWYDVLCRLPRNVMRHAGKHKRNATFPGGTATTIIADHTSVSGLTYCTSEEEDAPVRQRFTSESVIDKRQEGEWTDWLHHHHANDDDVFPTKQSPPQAADDPILANKLKDEMTPNAELVNKEDSSDKNEEENSKKERCRRYMKREARTLRNQRSRSDGVAKMIPNREANQDKALFGNNQLDVASENEEKRGSPVPTRRRHTSDKAINFNGDDKKLKFVQALEKSFLVPLKPSKKSLKKSESLMDIPSELSPEMRQHISELKRNHSYKSTVHSKRDTNKEKTSCNQFLQPVRDTSSKLQVNGSEFALKASSSPSWESEVDICTQGMVLKKGWLFRRPMALSRDDWCRHWFVVKNASFTYYRDPSAEDCGIMDGVLDLNQVTSVEPLDIEKQYAFALNMWDGKKYVLSTVSSAARSSWMKAIQNASNLWDAESRKDFSNDEIILPDHNFSANEVQQKISEQTQDLSSSDDQSEYFSIIDDGEEDSVNNDRSSSPRTLPPSPPLNRTAMSLVKERARSRSNSSFSSITDKNRLSCEANTDGLEPYRAICEKLIDSSSLQLSSSESEDTKKEITEKDCKQKMNFIKNKNSQNQAPKELQERRRDASPQKNLILTYQDLTGSQLINALGEEKYQCPVESYKDNSDYRVKYEILKAKYLQDCGECENKIKKEKTTAVKSNSLGSYMKILQKTKKTVHELKEKFNLNHANQHNTYTAAATKDIQQLCKEIEKMSPYMEKKRDGDVKKLKKALGELQALYKSQQQRLQEEQINSSNLENEIKKKETSISDLQQEIQILRKEQFNLFAPVEEIDKRLCKNDISNSPDSDISNICRNLSDKLRISDDLVRQLKKDLKGSHASLDDLEIYSFQLKHDLKSREENHESQMSLMTARVDDLTSKLTISERNLRQLKQKITKLESKQERRRSSLKNKESITLSKECESKLQELEQKLITIEQELKGDESTTNKDNFLSTVDCERTLGKRLSQDSSSGSENTSSLLLRLHSLSVRTKAASEYQINAELDKPKIRFQLRSDSMAQEDECEDDDCGEDWSALSYSTSLTDLQVFDGLENCELPTTWPDIMECLDQKLENLLSWTRCSIQGVHRQETPFSENFNGLQSPEILDNLVLSSNLLEILESLNEIKSANDSNTKLSFKILLLSEVIKIVQRIVSFQTPFAFEKLFVCHHVFTFLEKHLQNFCDLENQCSIDLSETSILIQDLVQLSSASKKISNCDSLEDFVQISQHPSNRIPLLLEHTANLLNVLEEAKQKQFSMLLHTLADIPVQDPITGMQNNSVYDENFEFLDPLLQSMTAMVMFVHDTASSQLLAFHQENISLLSCDHQIVEKWYKNMQSTLKIETLSVIDELKIAYLQVREKNCFSCGLSDLSYKKIIYGSVALSMIALWRAITQGTLDFLCDERTTVNSVNESRKWIEKLHEQYLTKAFSFLHPEVNLTDFTTCHNVFLNQSIEMGMRELKMEAALLNFHQKKTENLFREIESVKIENSSLKATCDSNEIRLQDLQNQLEEVPVVDSCQVCHDLENQLQTIKKQQEAEIFSLDKKYKEKMEQMQKHLHFVLEQKNEIHAQEVQKLDEQLQAARSIASHLEVEYNEQVHHLKDLYQKKMLTMHDPINEVSVRRKYQAEIEQLKELWEKGLIVVQNSYRQLTTELERRHQQEISLLEEEKEKLLKEETQATLTALEVMRRYHDEELQRQVSKCQEEILKNMNSQPSLHPTHESEMEEVKHEIMSLTEKYSVKCLEGAVLEERAQSLQQQLQEANHELFDLTTRNKQLKIQLSNDIEEMKRQPDSNEKALESLDYLKLQLKLKIAEIAEQKEMNAQSKQELHLAQMHVSLLDAQCEQLYQSLNAERKLREEEVNNLRSRLETIITASLAHADDPTLKSAGSRVWSPTGSFLCRAPSLSLSPNASLEKLTISFPSIAQNKEILRSSSWSGMEYSDLN